jgi:hypothetical protein
MVRHTENDAEMLQLLEKASEQNDREGLFELGGLLRLHRKCKDDGKAMELYRCAAELNHRHAQFVYGQVAFGRTDWERFYWCAKAAEGGVGVVQLASTLRAGCPSFNAGIRTAAPVIRNNLEKWNAGGVFRSIRAFRMVECRDMERVFELHAAMLSRAKRAVDCWSMAARRCRVVKDMRVVIAKMLWAEAWRWGDSENAEHERREEGNKKAKRS